MAWKVPVEEGVELEARTGPSAAFEFPGARAVVEDEAALGDVRQEHADEHPVESGVGWKRGVVSDERGRGATALTEARVDAVESTGGVAEAAEFEPAMAEGFRDEPDGVLRVQGRMLGDVELPVEFGDARGVVGPEAVVLDDDVVLERAEFLEVAFDRAAGQVVGLAAVEEIDLAADNDPISRTDEGGREVWIEESVDAPDEDGAIGEGVGETVGDVGNGLPEGGMVEVGGEEPAAPLDPVIDRARAKQDSESLQTDSGTELLEASRDQVQFGCGIGRVLGVERGGIRGPLAGVGEEDGPGHATGFQDARRSGQVGGDRRGSVFEDVAPVTWVGIRGVRNLPECIGPQKWGEMSGRRRKDLGSHAARSAM